MWALVVFTVGVLIGTWRADSLHATDYTCALCEEPIATDQAFGHRACYHEAQVRTLRMQRVMREQQAQSRDAGVRTMAGGQWAAAPPADR